MSENESKQYWLVSVVLVASVIKYIFNYRITELKRLGVTSKDYLIQIL